MILRELWALTRDAVVLMRRLPVLVADWCDRQVMDAHHPEMVPADPPVWPNGEMPWCLRCDTSWPCDPHVRAYERLTARAGGSS